MAITKFTRMLCHNIMKISGENIIVLSMFMLSFIFVIVCFLSERESVQVFLPFAYICIDVGYLLIKRGRDGIPLIG